MYTPLTRRFANERNRELRETRDLYGLVKQEQYGFSETITSVGGRIFPVIGHLPETTQRPLAYAFFGLLHDEAYIWELPAPDIERMSMREFVEFRNLLHHKQYFLANRDALIALLEQGLTELLEGLARHLPEAPEPAPFTVPLLHVLPAPGALIEGIYGTLVAPEYRDHGLFKSVTEQLYANICVASGREPYEASARRLVLPSKSPLPPDELVDAYLAHTPFRDVFLAPVPLSMRQEDRFSHMHVLAGSGHGKTTLIENLIRHDLASDDPPTIVLVDPHSDLVRKLVRSDLGVEDRLILIDPRDTAFPIALNPFAVNQARLAQYDERTREQVSAGVIQTFGYLFSGLTNLTLTGKQEVFFRYVARLMLSLPESLGRNATILDILHLMNDPMPYGPAIDHLPPIPREFFARDFMGKTFEATKEQIRYRLQALVESPTMARLFTAPETKVDLFAEMNRGAVILVDTAKDFLKEGSSAFGKLIVSLILQAVLERAAIPEGERKPTFIMIDEAASFFSSNIDDLLTEARKYKAGLLLAHQYLDQASGPLRASLHANTGIKFAGGLSSADASAMARELRTSPEFILGQPKLHFAAYVRSGTPHAVSVTLEPVRHSPQLSGEAYAALVEQNRSRVSAGPTGSCTEPDTQTSPTASTGADNLGDDISPTW